MQLNAKLRILDGRLAVHATPGQWTICVQIRMHARPGSNYFEVSEAISHFCRDLIGLTGRDWQLALTVPVVLFICLSPRRLGLLPPSRRLCFHPCLSVCLLYNTIQTVFLVVPTIHLQSTEGALHSQFLWTGFLKNWWSNLYEIVLNGWTLSRDQIDYVLSDFCPHKVKVVKGQKVKKTFLRITSFKVLVESRNKN